MLDFLENLFCRKYWWDFYDPKGFTDKEWVCARYFTGKQAIRFSMDNGYIYGLRLTNIE